MKKIVLKQGETSNFNTKVVLAIKETGEILGSIMVSVPLTLISSGEQAVVLVEEGSATSIRRLSVGERIKALRIKTGMSQKALADLLGITKQAIYKYENDLVTDIPLGKIEQMALVFCVSPAYLAGWSE